MGNQKQTLQYKWQVQAKVVAARASPPLLVPFPDPARLVFSSPSAESPASSRLAASPSVLVQVPQCTSLPSLSTSLLRSSSSQVTPPRTTRRPESSPDTSSSLSATTRNLTSSSATQLSLLVVSSPTSTSSSSPKRRRRRTDRALSTV